MPTNFPPPLPPLYIARDGRFLKPLLDVSKSDLVDYLQSSGHEWREDESNAERGYTRNTVRLDVVPLLEQVAGGREALQRRMGSLSKQSSALRTTLVDATYACLERHAGGIEVHTRADTRPPRPLPPASQDCASEPHTPHMSVVRVDLPLAMMRDPALSSLEASEVLHCVVRTLTGIHMSADAAQRALLLAGAREKEGAATADDSEPQTAGRSGSGGGGGGVMPGHESRSMSLSGGWRLTRVGEVLRLLLLPSDHDHQKGHQKDHDHDQADTPVAVSSAGLRSAAVVRQATTTTTATAMVHFPSDMAVTAEEGSLGVSAADTTPVTMVLASRSFDVALVRVALSLHAVVTVRVARPGDKFRPAWRGGSSVRLVDFLRGQVHTRAGTRVHITYFVTSLRPSPSSSNRSVSCLPPMAL